MALCLAVEADALGGGDIGEAFWMLAAMITWLERRHVGIDPPVERLVLALS